jgi:signal transduction histidine kinase
MTRPKSFLTYFILCAIPLLLLAGVNYWNGLTTVDSTLSVVVQNDLNSLNVAVDEVLRDSERHMRRLALTPNVQSALANNTDVNVIPMAGDLQPQFQSLALFDRDRQLLWIRQRDTIWLRSSASKRPDYIPQPDPRVWGMQGNDLVDRPGSASSTLEYTSPVPDEKGSPVGALVGVLDLKTVFSIASRGLGSTITVLDRSGTVVYNTDPFLLVESSSGTPLRRSEAHSPIPKLNLAVGAARPQSAFTSPARVRGIAGLVLAVLGALAAAFILERHVQRRSRGIARVTEDVSAIAKGELDRRIILQSSDDARGLADNINVVTERLRAQIAREEESRQFESFLRLSAMLTHDLKNAIEGLSLTVGNMERHFDNPQFRTDALKGLTTATEKLKALVARLSKPLTSLSGEHKRPTNVDLIPIIQRVLATNAEPTRGKHKIVTRLPPSLFVLVDAARIEEVIENLVLNALEAMTEMGGTLTVEAGQDPNGAPMFSVSDTGRGMSRSFIEHRLFRPFSTTKKTGIGLGLYTCREAIKASAGSIEVDSVEGAGTTFRVVLPSISHDRRN